MNIYDIAKLSGVSIATVSRVLNNRPGVSEASRMKVMSVVDETYFIPNQLAKSLTNKKTEVVGLLMPGINHYFSNRIDAINKVCKQEGYSLMITANYKDTNNIEEDMANFNLLMEKRVDGIIYFPTHVTPQHIETINRISKKIPIVITDQLLPGVALPYVLQDNASSSREIMNYLIKGGHQHIGFINGLSYDQPNTRRYQVFNEEMEKAGLPVKAEWILQGNFSMDSGYMVMKQLIESKETLPTAIFAANDNMAIGAMKAASEHGIAIPDQISIIGYDDIEFGKFYAPSLTTVSADQYIAGELAAKTLIRCIENKKWGYEVHELDYKFIERDSSKTLIKIKQ